MIRMIGNAPRLGVNLDHIATLRQLRGTRYPSLIEAAQITSESGADLITVHLREDRRHIQDSDVFLLKKKLKIPLNLEMAATSEMQKIALRLKPAWVCLVPEKRQELTTEGGLALDKNKKRLSLLIGKLKKGKIKVSLFLEPSLKTMKDAYELGADAVELHTGTYCNASPKKVRAEVLRIKKAGALAKELGLHVHAGHGFDYKNVRKIISLTHSDGMPLIEEYNIGHSIVCRAALVGLSQAVREMNAAIKAP